MKITNKALLCLSLMLFIFCSCSNDKTAYYDSDTFETKSGYYSLEYVKRVMYGYGVSDASMVKDLGPGVFNAPECRNIGTYEEGKDRFMSLCGLPKDENAKKAMEEAIKAYLEGYQDGINF